MPTLLLDLHLQCTGDSAHLDIGLPGRGAIGIFVDGLAVNFPQIHPLRGAASRKTRGSAGLCVGLNVAYPSNAPASVKILCMASRFSTSCKTAIERVSAAGGLIRSTACFASSFRPCAA